MRDEKTAEGGRIRIFTTKFDDDCEVEAYLNEKVAAGCTVLSAQYRRSFEYTPGSMWTVVYQEPAERRPAMSLPARLSTVSRNLAGGLMGRIASALRHQAS